MNDTAVYSYVNMILLSVLGGAFVIFLAIASWWAKDVHVKLTAATKAADAMESWSENHDEKDEVRHADNKEVQNGTRKAVHDLRDQLAEFAIKMRITTARHDR